MDHPFIAEISGKFTVGSQEEVDYLEAYKKYSIDKGDGFPEGLEVILKEKKDLLNPSKRKRMCRFLTKRFKSWFFKRLLGMISGKNDRR